MNKEFNSLEEFYPFYLSEHGNKICRRLHILGTTLSLIIITLSIIFKTYWVIPFGIIQGYAFAWIGHFVFEKNKPATFKWPLYSFICDFKMMIDWYLGKISR
ncbi:MAG: Mpo1-like protein [Bacteriovoracaceae bacterium]